MVTYKSKVVVVQDLRTSVHKNGIDPYVSLYDLMISKFICIYRILKCILHISPVVSKKMAQAVTRGGISKNRLAFVITFSVPSFQLRDRILHQGTICSFHINSGGLHVGM